MVIQRMIDVIESISESIGRIVAWLLLVMVMLICYDVAMRYLFQSGSVALQELEWHIFSLIFLLGAAYTFKHDGHVRVDVFYQSRFMSGRHRAMVDFIGGLVFLIPFCILVIVGSVPFIESAYNFSEGSPDPGGLPYRFVLKAAIPVGFFLLLLQGIAAMLSSIQVLRAEKELRSSQLGNK